MSVGITGEIDSAVANQSCKCRAVRRTCLSTSTSPGAMQQNHDFADGSVHRQPQHSQLTALAFSCTAHCLFSNDMGADNDHALAVLPGTQRTRPHLTWHSGLIFSAGGIAYLTARMRCTATQQQTATTHECAGWHHARRKQVKLNQAIGMGSQRALGATRHMQGPLTYNMCSLTPHRSVPSSARMCLCSSAAAVFQARR